MDGPSKDDLPAAPAPRGARRNWLGWALAALILIACIAFLDFGEIVSKLASIHPAWLAAILVLMSIDRVWMAWKWWLLLRSIEIRVPLGRVVQYYYQGTLTAIFMPSGLGGDILRAYWVSDLAGTRHPVFAALLMEKMLGFLSAMNWAVAGAVVLGWTFYGAATAAWLGLGIAALVAMNGLFLLSLRPAVHGYVLGLLRRFSSVRLIGTAERFYAAYARFGHARRGLALNMALTLGEQLLQMCVVFVIARSIGIAAAPVAFVAVTALHTLLYRLPISPDGWGIAEVSAIGLYGLIGVGSESAFALAFLYHVLALVVASPGFWFLLRNPGRASAAARTG